MKESERADQWVDMAVAPTPVIDTLFHSHPATDRNEDDADEDDMQKDRGSEDIVLLGRHLHNLFALPSC